MILAVRLLLEFVVVKGILFSVCHGKKKEKKEKNRHHTYPFTPVCKILLPTFAWSFRKRDVHGVVS